MSSASRADSGKGGGTEAAEERTLLSHPWLAWEWAGSESTVVDSCGCKQAPLLRALFVPAHLSVWSSRTSKDGKWKEGRGQSGHQAPPNQTVRACPVALFHYASIFLLTFWCCTVEGKEAIFASTQEDSKFCLFLSELKIFSLTVKIKRRNIILCSFRCSLFLFNFFVFKFYVKLGCLISQRTNIVLK